MLNLFGHANETHATPTEATLHWLQAWYISLPLLALAILAIAGVAYVLTNRSKAKAYLITAGVLLAIGVLAYNISAPASVAALSVGMGMMLLIVIVSLMPKQSN